MNADPVTKNALTAGGGLEFFIRNDLALRAEVVHATVFGSQSNGEGIVAYPIPPADDRAFVLPHDRPVIRTTLGGISTP